MSLHEKSTPKHFPRFLKMPFVSGVTLLYLVIGELWIFSSDLLINFLGKATGEHLCILSTSRGLLFIFSTGALLFLALNHFISKIRLTHRHVLESEERYEIATSAANIGVWDRDIVNNHLVWDKQMAQIYGIPHAEFNGAYEAWKECVHPEDRAHAEQAVKLAERGEKDFDIEFRIVRPDGEVRHIKAFGKAFHDKDGKPVRMTGINYDVTQSRQAEESLRSHNEELGRFNRAATGRELRMVELKKEINQLCQQLGQAAPYVVTDADQGSALPRCSGSKTLLRNPFGKGRTCAAEK
jgi:PAS domain S-box-containing protein